MKVTEAPLEIRQGRPFCLPGRYRTGSGYLDLSDLEFTFVVYDGKLTTDPQLVSLTTGGPLKDSVADITPQVLVSATNISTDFDGSGTIIASGAGFTAASVGDIAVVRGGPYPGEYVITAITDDSTIVVNGTFVTAALGGTVEVHLLGGILVKISAVDTAALSLASCATWSLDETTLGTNLGAGSVEIHNRVV